MTLFILSFLSGVLWLQTFAALPSIYFVITLLTLSLIPIFIFDRKLYTFLVFAFAIGFSWALWYAHSISSWTLSKEWEGKQLIATGSISSLPHPGRFGTQFEFHLDQLSNFQSSEYPNKIIRLTWPDHSTIHPPHLNAGDKWRLLVKLKRIHAIQSPGAYDYEAWAFQKGIRASGSIRDSRINKLISHGKFSHPLLFFRQQLQEKIQRYSPHTQTSPWLTALITGERNGISQSDWQVLRNTGTNHLMAIGGLHIGMLAGFVYMIVSWCWRKFPRAVLMLPAQHAAASAAFVMAVLYSALSGFSLPAQRASLMLSVFFIAMISVRKINPWNAWSLAILCVLILNPLSVLSDSFWLSFGTIGLILYGMHHRLSPSGIWWKYARVQWVIGLGLIPLSLLLFQECSLVSFIANSIAIPWLGIAILPFCLLSALFLFISPTFSSLLLWIADQSLAGLWMVLSYLAQFDVASLHVYVPNYFLFFLMMMGFLFFLLPSGLPGRWLGIVWILPVLLYQPTKPRMGEYSLTLLDVGQGLSAVVQTSKHTLVYDTGPRFEGGADMGENVVLPYLRKIKTRDIDLMVISHGDNDHIGGLKAILKVFPNINVKTSVPDKIPSSHAQYCNAGDTWQWDGVTFTFLYPFTHKVNLRNDSSCVLMIDNGQYKVLLTGDIEKAAERELLLHTPEKLRANVLVAPHHGSKTSGMKSFINAVNPQVVLYATGYRNRYHFPHPGVVAAYESINAASYNLVNTGTILFNITRDTVMIPPESYRMVNKKYWYDESIV